MRGIRRSALASILVNSTLPAWPESLAVTWPLPSAADYGPDHRNLLPAMEKARANFLAHEHFERESVGGMARKHGSFQLLAGDWRAADRYLEIFQGDSQALNKLKTILNMLGEDEFFGKQVRKILRSNNLGRFLGLVEKLN